MRSDLQSAGQYWQQWTAVAMQTQREMMGSFSRMLENEKSGGLKWALDAFHANIPALAGSFFVVGSNRPSEQQHDS